MSPPDAPARFHGRLPGYRRTPLVRAPGAAERIGAADLLVKDESDRYGLPSFKVLGASWALCRYIEKYLGIGPDGWDSLPDLAEAVSGRLPSPLVTATDGNHGRGVARTASWLRVGCDVFVPAGTARPRIEGIESEGARVIEVDGDYDEAVRTAASRAKEGGLLVQDTAWPGYEEIPGWIVEGYSTIVSEAAVQLEELGEGEPGLVAVQIGVGSLAASVARSFGGMTGGSTLLVGVEPAGAACAFESAKTGKPRTAPGPHRSAMAGLNCGTLSSVAWPLLRDRFDIFCAIEDRYAFEAMRILRSDGIVSGESGAAGLAGLIALADDPGAAGAMSAVRRSAGLPVLVISTEGITDPESWERAMSGDRDSHSSSSRKAGSPE